MKIFFSGRLINSLGSVSRSHLRLSDEKGIALVWSAGISLGVFALISLAVSVLWLFSAAEQVSQFSEYWADAALRQYHILRDDPILTGNGVMTQAVEQTRMNQACTYGQNVAMQRQANLPFARNNSGPMTACQFGWMDLPPSPNAYQFNTSYPNWATHYDKNAVRIRVTQNVFHGPWSGLLTFKSGSSSDVLSEVYAVYDESLSVKGMYPYLVLGPRKP